MSQNTSSAVMQQRKEPHDSLDFFPTPPWATRAFVERVLRRELTQDTKAMRCWEPACGRGDMAKPLSEYFAEVAATDVWAHGYGGVHDFLMPWLPFDIAPDWIISNPPFKLGAEFIQRALSVATRGVAMLVRSAFLESGVRYDDIYAKSAPSLIAQYVERVPMVKGRLDCEASTATAYCWLVWERGPCGWRSLPGQSTFLWIPPSRQMFDRDADYEAYRA